MNLQPSRPVVIAAASAFAFGLFPIQQQARSEWGGVGGESPHTPQVLTPSPTDTDGDGIPNTWEDANFLSKTNPADALSDFDQDGLTALQEYQLSTAPSAPSGQYGKHLGKWAISAIPRPTGYTTATPLTTLIECASNGIILARVNGVLTGDVSSTTFPYIYSPATGAWTRIPAPADFPTVASLTPLDVNSSGQVVGYFNSGGTKGFLYTPDANGGHTEVFGLHTGGGDLVAIPKRISDNGSIVGSVGTMGGRSFAASQYGWEITFPGMSANPVFVDANDYGEFIGTVYNPLTSQTETFLAAEGFPIFFTGISQSAFDGTAGLWGSIPDIDPSAIIWDTTSSNYYFKKGTVIDRQTGALVNVSQGYGASFYWKSNLTYYGGYPLWYSYPGFSSVIGSLNDWGEFASLYSGSMSGAYFDSYGSQSSADNPTDSGMFFFDGGYHLSKARPSIFGVSNDPRVLVGTPFALWSGSLTVPIANLIPPGNPTVFASARIADNGTVILQQSGNAPIYILKSNDDADHDGMPDDWEKYYGLNPNDASDASADLDQDGVNNLTEFKYRTNPALVPVPGSSGQFIDIRPGIDTDGDGMPNTWEWKYGLNFNDATDASADADYDGLTNLREFRLGTNPKSVDSDNDGVPDWNEISVNFTDPLSSRDYDSDGMADDWEKAFAAQLLALGRSSSSWGENYGDLLSGNLNPSKDYTAEGITAKRLASFASSAVVQQSATKTDLEVQGKRNILSWGLHVPAADGRAERNEGLYLATNDGYYGVGRDITSESELQPQYLASQVLLNDWEDDLSGGFAKFSATNHPGSNATDYYGEVRNERQRMVAVVPAKTTIVENYFKVLSKKPVEDGFETFVSADLVQFTIPVDGLTSNWVELTPPVVPGWVYQFKLLPVDTTVVFGIGPSAPAPVGHLTSRQLLENYLDTVKVSRNGNVWLIKGTQPGGSDRLYCVEIADTEEKLLSALGTGGMTVVFDGHANFGLGPSFSRTSAKTIADFTNFGVNHTDIPQDFRGDGTQPDPMPYYGPNGQPLPLDPQTAAPLAVGLTHLNDEGWSYLNLQQGEIMGVVSNYTVPYAGGLRYENDQGVNAAHSFTKKGQGFNNEWHFSYGGEDEKRLIVSAPSSQVPKLLYDTFFYNACNTGIHYIENFKHGKFVYTTRICNVVKASSLFVKHRIEGKTAEEATTLLDGQEDADDNMDSNSYDIKVFPGY